jgi:hypothetical protein
MHTTFLVGKHEGKRSLGKPWRRCKEKKTDLKRIGYEGVDWVYVTQGGCQRQALVNTAVNFWVPQRAGYSLTSCANINFSGRTLLHGVSWERIFTL